MKFLALSVMLSLSSAWALALNPFELPWMNAATPKSTFNSASHKDGVLVIEAYFLGCPYCNSNASNVDDLASYFSSDPRVQVLDIGIDKRDDQYAEWIRRHNPNHPVLKDAKRVVIKQLGTSGYPSTYVVNCNGKVVYKTSGEWDSDTAEEIKDAVTNTLQNQICL